MSFHHLDHYAHVDSPVTRRPPEARLAGAVVMAVAAAVLPLGAWPQMAALGALVALLALTARIEPGVFLARLAAPLAFVLLVSVALLVLAPGQTVARLGPLRITDAGMLRFGSAAGRGAIGLGAAVVLVSTTRFTDLLEALRRLRLPEVVTTSLGLAYRYLYILTDEVDRIRRAARSRNAAGGAASRRRLLMGVTAAALQRSLDRSERVHQAMLARGFTGALPTLGGGPGGDARAWEEGEGWAGGGRVAAELLGLTGVAAAVVASAWV